jgi:hypothetical protein
MASAVGILLVVVGILLGSAGGTLWIISQASYNDCQDDLFRAGNRNVCQEAAAEQGMGIAALIIALALTIIGIILIAAWKPILQYPQFTCPRCQAILSYQHSPTNCSNCGIPVDWSMGKNTS